VTFASSRQIAILIVLTAGLLFGIDRLKNPRRAVIPGEVGATSVGADEPTIRLWLNEPSCSGCLGGLEKALSGVPWLGAPKVLEKVPTLEQPEQAPGIANQHWQQTVVEIKVAEKSVANVDFGCPALRQATV